MTEDQTELSKLQSDKDPALKPDYKIRIKTKFLRDKPDYSERLRGQIDECWTTITSSFGLGTIDFPIREVTVIESSGRREDLAGYYEPRRKGDRMTLVADQLGRYVPSHSIGHELSHGILFSLGFQGINFASEGVAECGSSFLIPAGLYTGKRSYVDLTNPEFSHFKKLLGKVKDGEELSAEDGRNGTARLLHRHLFDNYGGFDKLKELLRRAEEGELETAYSQTYGKKLSELLEETRSFYFPAWRKAFSE